MYFEWRPYVSVAERRRRAMREMDKRRKQGHSISPVTIEGRTIAHTFWGKAWCENLEHYSDFANRLPRGRTYVRNGSVVDLQIAPGQVTARVSGSELYQVSVEVAPVSKPQWRSLCADSAGAIDSLVELLQGRFAKGVMQRLCQQQTGLFPAPRELTFSCSCPDWASMCKHVAAVFYGIGARLDERPELLFKLRQVDENDLVATAGTELPLSKRAPISAKVLADDDLAGLFGLDLEKAKPRQPQSAATAKTRKPRSSSPRRKSDRAVRSGFGPDARSSEAPNTGGIQASGDAADGPEPARTATRRLSPRAARAAARRRGRAKTRKKRASRSSSS